MKASINYIYVIIVILFSSYSSECQQLTAKESLTALQNGVLVVRLDMQKNKIDAYQQAIDSGKLSAKDFDSMNSKLAELQKDRIQYKNNVIKAFSENYLFSKVVFIENQDFKNFINGEDVKIEGREADRSLLKTSENIYYLIKGNSDSQWIIVNQDFKRPAFPSKFSQSPFYKFLLLLSPGKASSYESQVNAAKKVNEKLFERQLRT